jgi:hypothetical protein
MENTIPVHHNCKWFQGSHMKPSCKNPWKTFSLKFVQSQNKGFWSEIQSQGILFDHWLILPMTHQNLFAKSGSLDRYFGKTPLPFKSIFVRLLSWIKAATKHRNWVWSFTQEVWKKNKIQQQTRDEGSCCDWILMTYIYAYHQVCT